MLHVITEGQYASQFTADRGQGTVVIESDIGLKNGSFNDAIGELDSPEAKKRALGFANSNGVGDARINGLTSGVYAVNVDGIPLDAVRDATGQPYPLTHPKMQPSRYRANIPVTRRLV